MSLFDELNSLEDIDRLIRDGVRESETIDYKRADHELRDPHYDEIAKDLSAFANSSGGVIVYGVETRKDLDGTVPDRRIPIDPDNVIRITRAANNYIRHPIPGLRYKAIPATGVPEVYVVEVPQSALAPHQSLRQKQYFRRHGESSEPMAHDLVELYFGRRLGPMLRPEVRNVGKYGGFQPGQAAVTFELWLHNDGAGTAREITVAARQIVGTSSLLSSSQHGPHYPNHGNANVREYRAEPPALIIHPVDAKPAHPGLLVVYPHTLAHAAERFTVRVFADKMRPVEYELFVRWTASGALPSVYVGDRLETV